MRGTSLLLPALGAVLAAAEFTEPSSSRGDFSQSYKVGEVDIAWNAGWDWGKGAQPEVADLFVMRFDDPKQFSQLVLGMSAMGFPPFTVHSANLVEQQTSAWQRAETTHGAWTSRTTRSRRSRNSCSALASIRAPKHLIGICPRCRVEASR